jgi:hypothetical protein
VLTAVGACNPFYTSLDAPDAGTEGGLPDAAETGVADGGVLSVTDAPSSTSDAMNASDAAASDAAPTDGGTDARGSGDGGFCAGFTKPIFCFDFDEAQSLPSGLATSVLDGGFAFPATFPTGSLPTALDVSVASANGHATVTAPTIDLTKYPASVIEIDFGFEAGSAAVAIEYLARFNFTNESAPVGLDAMNGFTCGNTIVANLAAGVHRIVVDVTVDAGGNAASFVCKLDGVAGAASPVSAASTTLAVELGNQIAGAAFSVSYDDFVAHSP